MPRKMDDDVMLSDGTGFMTAQENYQAHLKIAQNIRPVSNLKLIIDGIILIYYLAAHM